MQEDQDYHQLKHNHHQQQLCNLQSYDHQLESPQRKVRAQTALGNLTNNLNALNLSPSRNSLSPDNSQRMSLVKSPSFCTNNQQRKSVALEQENLMLKTQIELLQSALLGLCKDKGLQVPQIGQSQNLQELMGLITSVSQQQQHQTATFNSNASPLKNSLPYQGKNNNQGQVPLNGMPMVDLSAINQKDENSISKLSICCSPSKESPSKSASRRKRSQRILSPMKQNENQCPSQQESPCGQNLPLQIQFKRSQVISADDTLVFDKSMDLNARVEQAVDESSCINLIVLPQNNEEEPQSPEKLKDNSQIHIKYAKMLEELENDSMVQINTILEVPEQSSSNPPEEAQSEKEEFSLKLCPIPEIKTMDVNEPQRNEPLLKPTHQKNQLSSHYETKHYYEAELNLLKVELEQFEQEEEKLLSMMVSTKRPSLNGLQANYAIRQESPDRSQVQADLTQEAIYDSHKKTNRDCESFQYVSGHAIEEFHRAQMDEEMQMRVSQEKMMLNLQEAYAQLQQIQEDPEEDSFIKPIKILSPQNKVQPIILIPSTLDQNNPSLPSYRRFSSKSKERYNKTPLHDKEVTSPEQPSYPLFSADKAVGHQSPYCDRYMHHHHHHHVNHPLRSSQQSSQERSGKKVTTQSIVNSKQKSSQVRRPQSTRGYKQLSNKKSPSKFSVTNLLSNMAQEKNSSPIRRFTRTSQTEESLDQVHQRLETLEKLSKHESMAKGLKQQEEPTEEEELNRQVFSIVPKPVERLTSEEDEVRLLNTEEKVLLMHPENNYFGLYSMEKSEQLKQQRVQSIKRAEELLSQFLAEECKTKRPEFIQQIKSASVIDKSKIQPFTQENDDQALRVEDSDEPQIEIFNEVSFKLDNQQHDYNKLRHYNRTSIDTQNNIVNVELVNLELSPEPAQVRIDMQNCNFQAFEELPLSLTSMTPQELTVHQTPYHGNTHCHKPSDDLSSAYNSNQSSAAPLPLLKQNLTSTTLRRKSLESTQSVVGTSKLTTMLLSQKNKASQLRKPTVMQPAVSSNTTQNTHKLSHLEKSAAKKDRSHLVDKPSINTLSSTQSHLEKSVKREKSREPVNLKSTGKSHNLERSAQRDKSRDKSLLSKTIEAGQLLLQPSFINLQTPTTNMNRCVQEPGFIKGMAGSTTLIDAETLYEHRSKSVVKKREELQKKKQQETLTKIEAKNHKVDNFKQTRNLNRLQSSQRLNSNEVSQSQINGGGNVQVLTQTGPVISQSKKSKISFDSQGPNNLNPIRNKSLEGRKQQHNYVIPDSIKKSESKNQIKFEKRRTLDSQHQQHQPTMLSEYRGILSTKNSLQQTPMSMTRGYNQVPSSNQSKSSKLVSECSSYRQRPDDYTTPSAAMSTIQISQTLDCRSQQQQQKSASKNSCNLMSKKSNNNNNLKSNIVNRTIRMTHQAKDYQQLKDEHQRLKQVMQHTIEVNASVAGDTKAQSFILQKISQQQQMKKKQQQQQSLTSSRSACKIKPAFKEDQVHSNYQTIQVEDSKGAQCQNCMRLKAKGLSTDFCLEHYGTPRYVDE